jgi:DNA-directed RNA polymerase specialized sigma24 family protein
MNTTARAAGHAGGRAPVRSRRRGRAAEAESRRVRTTRAETESPPAGAVNRRELEDLWDRHGGSVYALACALVGDEAAAAQAVELAMFHVARSTRGVSTEEARRCLVRHVYRHTQEHAGNTSGVLLSPVMVWVSQLARLQRAVVALCMFGGLTHREAAALLDVEPSTVAALLRSGLRELARLPADVTATSA